MDSSSKQELERLVSILIDGQLTDAEARQLDRLIAESPGAVELYHELLDHHAALCTIYPGDVYGASFDHEDARRRGAAPAASSVVSRHSWPHWALAASALIAVGLAGYWAGQGSGYVGSPAEPTAQVVRADYDREQTIAGHATLRRAVGMQWPAGSATFREGDVLPAGTLQFEEGLAEIDFFCGATLIVEGPARLDVESDWSVRVTDGRLRANVPPAARGFIVKAADSEIVDLGTEFALEVSSEVARLEVIDGEVKLEGGEHDGNHLLTGDRRWLKGTGAGDASLHSLSTVGDVDRRRTDAQSGRLAEWKAHSQRLRSDKRLIAYYPITDLQTERVAPNAALTGNELDGRLVGLVNRPAGRFGPESIGLEFNRPGSRVRVRIDGEYKAFTFACWVRIDSLEHRYNALFMGDGYENGEPHWQIRDDGRLMFSVMVDDSKEFRYYSNLEQKVVEDAGLHRVYSTEPFWDISKSGQWFHIAAVYDPVGRRVTQYVNGQEIGDSRIADEYHVSTLRIGPAEIGNWGQPFRDSPLFAVRNLNGTIDELAIFNAALSTEEIGNLYEQGKPLGY